MDYQGRSVVVTGGTGGLGVAVTDALLAAGAVCHIPYLVEAEARVFEHRDHKSVTLYPDLDVTDEAAVEGFYAAIPNLWASIHLVGGFVAGGIRTAAKPVVQHQMDVNFVTCYLCCRAAAVAMGSRGGRIVNVSARPGLESAQRRRHGGLCGQQGRGRRVDGRARRGARRRRHPGPRRGARDARYRCHPRRHAAGRLFGLYQSRGCGAHDPVSCLPGTIPSPAAPWCRSMAAVNRPPGRARATDGRAFAPPPAAVIVRLCA